MEIKDERWIYCGQCDRVSYELECCDNSICNGGGCDLCMDREEFDRRLEAGEHPPISELRVTKSMEEWIEDKGLE